MLTVRDRLQRVSFCRQRVYWTDQQWRRFLFTDESNYNPINRKTCIFVKRFAHEKYRNIMLQKQVQGGGGSVDIWDCFTVSGTGVCHIYSDRMNQRGYIQTLEVCYCAHSFVLFFTRFF